MEVTFRDPVDSFNLWARRLAPPLLFFHHVSLVMQHATLRRAAKIWLRLEAEPNEEQRICLEEARPRADRTWAAGTAPLCLGSQGAGWQRQHPA